MVRRVARTQRQRITQRVPGSLLGIIIASAHGSDIDRIVGDALSWERKLAQGAD